MPGILEGSELGSLLESHVEDAKLADELAEELLSDYLTGVT